MTLRVSYHRNDDTVTVTWAEPGVLFAVELPRAQALDFWHELGKVVAVEDNERRAQAGYERYWQHCGGVSVHGEPLPNWEQQADLVRGHWIAAFTE